MTRGPAVILAAAVGVFAFGCAETPTGAILLIRSELADASIDQVHVTVSRGSEAPRERRIWLGSDGASFPVRVRLVHQGGALGPIRVVVEGTGSVGSVTASAAPFYFARGEQLTIPITLTRECIGVSCEPRERCVAGECTEVIDPDGGPPIADAAPPAADAAPPAADAAPPTADTGPGDLGPMDMNTGTPDAGDCTAGCACFLHDECVGSHCDCEDGCACTFYCAPGESCGPLHCKDEGTRCQVRAANAADVIVDCDRGHCESVDLRGVVNAAVRCRHDIGCCNVDCSGATNCLVECERGASCRVDCDGAANCGFVEGDGCWAGEPVDCGGGVRVCGAASCSPDDGC